ncbi:uncharacterized protein LOC118778919 [Megalops cyprinoides]|uniref:uncharacterized protein LOC118778919 n=1 Tax=Megalops cyprinoides TaxID=118141 RepID=UPI001864FDDE|nr:uncharacterized protein LOC118778919 [Megalops cyprinoides]
MESESAFPQEQITCSDELENRELDQMLDPTRPVYAISSFWDEMEKLTINDIIQLRLVNNAHIPSESPQLQDSAMADVSDAADSGYFTHLDDSKPDRSTGDASLFSEFEEEYFQAFNASTNPSPEPPDTKPRIRRSPESTCRVWWECDLDPTCAQPDNDAEERMMLCSENIVSQPLFSDSAQFSRTMLKNIHMQNLKALWEESQAFNGLSLPTVVIEEEESSMLFSLCHKAEEICDQFLMERGSGLERSSPRSSPTFLPGEALSESYMVPFSGIFNHPFAEEEAGTGVSDRASPVVPLDTGDLTLPETYDYFFSEFEAGNTFFPLAQRPDDRKDKSIPIFSCSRSGKRKLRFLEEYDYFFPDDSPVESEDEDDHVPIRVVTRFNSRTCEPVDASAGPEMYEHFFSDKDCWANLFWRNPFSLRRVRFPGILSGSRGRSTPMVFPATDWKGKSLFRTMDPVSTTDNRDSIPPLPNVFYLENQLSREVAEQSKRCADLQAIISIPRKEGFLFTLNQSDICLVCIAFASWVLKSANPQSQDTWKTALLANVSAISAIRYLRRYVREESPGDQR